MKFMSELFEVFDVIENLFTDKYSYKTKIHVIAHLEKEGLLLYFIRKYLPEYISINPFTNYPEVDKFSLLDKIKKYEKENNKNGKE